MPGEPYTKAMLVSAPRIAGVRLRPLSCWHVLCLLAFGSPFATRDRPITEQDVIVALMICASGWTGDSARVGRVQRAVSRPGDRDGTISAARPVVL